MSRWYRAYEGTVTDAKLGEVALVAGCSRSVAIAAWHCILESAAGCNSHGRFDATTRRVAVILGEQPTVIEAVFSELVSLGMIEDGVVTAWSKRQFESDSSTERSRRRREQIKAASETPCNGDATLQQQDATPPYTDTDTDTDTDTEVVVSNETTLSETSSDAPKRKKISYPQDFEGFWKAYPTDPLMSKKEAAAAWTRLSADDRVQALKAVPVFFAHCRKTPDYRPLHAVRFLSQRRFEGFATGPADAPSIAPPDLASLSEKYGWKPGKAAS